MRATTLTLILFTPVTVHSSEPAYPLLSKRGSKRLSYQISCYHMNTKEVMPVMKGNYNGTYKVRRVANGEQLIHVPATVTGDYALYLDADGTMTFVPVGVRH